jgi:hypothetical protein
VASVVDVLQTPAFLCRQTNFIQQVVSVNSLKRWPKQLAYGKNALTIGKFNGY